MCFLHRRPLAMSITLLAQSFSSPSRAPRAHSRQPAGFLRRSETEQPLATGPTTGPHDRARGVTGVALAEPANEVNFEMPLAFSIMGVG